MKSRNIVFNLKIILFCLVFSPGLNAKVMPNTMAHSDKNISDLIKSGKGLAKEIPFTKKDFGNAQKEGKHIVIDVWKRGCPTCKAQKPTLKIARKKFPNAIFMKVDFDKQKDIVQMFNVIKQSTIIVFKGKKETGRVLGETNKNKLLALIKTGV